MYSKNWFVIYHDGRTPSLAPAYDYVSTVVYMLGDDLRMNIAGTKQFTDVDDDLLARFASHARLARKPVLDAAHEMVDRMREAWREISDAFPMEKEHRDMVAAHMDSVPLFGARFGLATPRKQ